MKPVAEYTGPELSNEHLAAVLTQIKRNARDRRIALMAPLALVGAVLGTLVAAPPQYGGLALPEAEAAVTQLPRVFGANGVWREAEPIAESPVGVPGPASVVRAATGPIAPSYVLAPPDRAELFLPSLPVSTSPPPTSTPGQSFGRVYAELDWSDFDPAGVERAATVLPADPPTPSSWPSGEDPTTTTNGNPVAVAPQDELESSTANPSTPASSPEDFDDTPSTAGATISQKSVLVYSAHVSVTVVVVDDDSSVIDWCKTRVDWGDGSVTRAADTYGVAPCTALCEYGATPSGVGINTELVFTHNYSRAIDAAPRILVATGDGCNSDITELQLNPFRVIPF